MSYDGESKRRSLRKLVEIREREAARYAAEQAAGASQVYRLLGLCERCDHELEKCTCTEGNPK